MKKQDVRELVFKQLQSSRAKKSFERMKDERVKVLDEFGSGLNVIKGIYGESPSVVIIDEEGN